MKYHEAAMTLFDLRRFDPRPGTEATASLLAHLGDPHEGVPCVQVAGTNGKGSTARLLEAVCLEAGLAVGLYTSPHLDDLRDRIRVDGRAMREDALAEFVESAGNYLTDTAAAGESPTFFETVTAMAFWEFDRRDVDVAVLEVGIGGRYDATSVVDPVAAAVTGVAREHTTVLGDDVASIAREQAAVAPEGRPLVTAARGDALAAVREAAGEVVVVDDAGRDPDAADQDRDSDVAVASLGRDGLSWRVAIHGAGVDAEVPLALLGGHQARNAGVAAALADQVAQTLGVDLTTETVTEGLRKATLPGRFEVLGRDPLVVLDGAHNPDGCSALADTLSTFAYDDLYLVTGALADKDLEGMASALPDPAHVVACQPDLPRAEEETVVARAFERATAASVESRADVAGALHIALEAAGPNDCVLVAGSLYAVAEARTRWKRPTIPKRVDSLATARETLADAHVTAAGAWRMRGKAVHRVVRTRVQPRQAQYLKEELLSLGGECAISGLNDQRRERLAVVMMGTMAQFKRLIEKLDGQPYGLARVAADLRTHLGIGTTEDSRGYPWEGKRTAVMGILNVTPDSFHDGGEYEATRDAVTRGEAMVTAGADIVDVGGESTRPGAEPVPVAQERERVIPVVEALAEEDAMVSVDTRKPAVARAALEAGADILNDVTGLEDPEMRAIAAEYDAPAVLMHSIDAPVVPEHDVPYDDVVRDVIEELGERVLLAERAGLDRSQIIVDPGLGFGKTAAENFELLGRLDELQALGCPVLVGHSHKSMYDLIGQDPGERREPTLAATALAVDRGADVVRVHDVATNLAALDTVAAAEGRYPPGEE
ncbi:MAG: dihydropteroate synthase [Haloarculaceae archaeon]